MDYYESLLFSLKNLNPGTRFFINRLLNRDRLSFMENIVSLLRQINDMEEKTKNLSGEEMKKKTSELKERLSKGESLNDILPEAFALVRESGKRFLNMRHFDVQVLGGISLHHGNVAEMATGEGKTLVATFPLYLNALSGEGCHLVTVNDYLAKRDTQWMGPIYHNLGLSVGCIVSYKEMADQPGLSAFVFDPAYMPSDSRYLNLRPVSRRDAYLCDITYGVGSEFGFDYLRDNMAIKKDFLVQRVLNYAIVDEVDSILIDEARTPLIISGPSEESTQLYYEIDKLVRKINKDKDYFLDEENQIVSLTDDGLRKCERLLNIENLYDGAHTEIVHLISQALRAHAFFKRDKEYVVKNGEVIIVDEFTGRLMPGRRWSDGLHQSVEAKEGVKIESENQTLATISFQNYFRLYKKLAGMTGTALTEAAEFKEIYKLNVIVIPPNKTLNRTVFDDEIYKAEKEKLTAVVNEIEEMHKTQRPVLVGTVSIEKAEKLSRMLRYKTLPHQVLHGKNHEAEAAIIAQTGRPKAITIATQMAGRGVDIILGGNPAVLAREETIRTIWSQKSKTKTPTSQQKLFHEMLNDIEEKYKKTIEEIETSLNPVIEQAKTGLTEKERVFGEIEKKTKESFERSIFMARAEDEYLRSEPRILKLKEKYDDAESLFKKAQKEYNNKPERMKEFQEALGRTYRDYEGTKEFLRKKTGVFTRRDVEEKTNQVILFCENPPEKTPVLKKELGVIIEDLLATIKGYEESLLPVLSEETKNTSWFKDFWGRSKKIKTYLEDSSKQLFELPSEQCREYVKNFLEHLLAEYKNFISGLDSFESEALSYLGGKEYEERKKEYKHALETHETLHSQHDKSLSFAREEYEKNRGSLEEEWKTVREEMEKSPEEFSVLYDKILEKHLKPWEKDHQTVVSLGGLHIIGTERHDSRRIDNQLKGRAGRQGDPGSAKFFLSLEDDLLRIFGSERLMGIMGKLPEGETIAHPIITKQINMAQKRVEGRNFEIRKHLLDFDDVLNQQRKVIYGLRQDILAARDIEGYIVSFINDTLEDFFNKSLDEKVKTDDWHPENLSVAIKNFFGVDVPLSFPDRQENLFTWREKIFTEIKEKITSLFQEKKTSMGPVFDDVLRYLFLQEIDHRWKSHLRAIDDLREGINLRSYAQRDILVAYKQEAFLLFDEMLSSLRTEILLGIFKIKTVSLERTVLPKQVFAPTGFVHKEFEQFESLQVQQAAQPAEEPVPVGPETQTNGYPHPQTVRLAQKVGRNQQCPCGSGKKYKHCCGKI